MSFAFSDAEMRALYAPSPGMAAAAAAAAAVVASSSTPKRKHATAAAAPSTEKQQQAKKGNKKAKATSGDGEEEEEEEKKKKKKKKKKAKARADDADEDCARAAPAQQQQQQPGDAAMMIVDEDETDGRRGFDAMEDMLRDAPAVAIQPMSAFTQAFPFTQVGTDCALALAKLNTAKAELSSNAGRRMREDAHEDTLVTLSEHKKDLSVVQNIQLHLEASQHEPVELLRLREARANLIVPDYTAGTRAFSHQEACQLLRSRNVSIPLISADTESEMLRQAGTWVFPGVGRRDFPPCCYGNRCIGMRPGMVHNLTEPVVFMRAMTEKQWAALKERNEQPSNKGWPCVLDGRMHTTEYVMLERLQPRPGHTIEREEPEAVYQLWRNLVDQPGGYHRQYVYMPRENEILIDPIARFNMWALPAVRPAVKGGAWTVSQEAIVFRPPPPPAALLGESVQDFCGGASSSRMPPSGTTQPTRASSRPFPTVSAACSSVSCVSATTASTASGPTA